MPTCLPTCSVVRTSRLGLVVVASVVLVDVSRAALAQTQAVVGRPVAEIQNKISALTMLLLLVLPRSIGLVLELGGAGLPGSGGHRNARVGGRVDTASSHSSAVLQSGHPTHSSIEICVAGWQGRMLSGGEGGS